MSYCSQRLVSAISASRDRAFAGDFLVTTLSLDGSSLEVALVDVSGKGRQAGSRSLHLSGAFGGLLGSVPARSFLSLANSYLVRQGWDEGFATAVHVEILSLIHISEPTRPY